MSVFEKRHKQQLEQMTKVYPPSLNSTPSLAFQEDSMKLGVAGWRVQSTTAVSGMLGMSELVVVYQRDGTTVVPIAS